MFGLLRTILKLAIVLVLVLVVVVLVGDFWPAPHDAPSVPCPHGDGFRCVRVSGRVLYHTGFGPGNRAHVVLLSRSSITVPGITVLELPRLRRPPAGLGIGDWVTVTGEHVTGSHDEQDVHVWAFATARTAVQCADPSSTLTCHSLALRGRLVTHS